MKFALMALLSISASLAEASQLDYDFLGMGKLWATIDNASSIHGQTFISSRTASIDKIVLAIGNASATTQEVSVEIYKFNSFDNSFGAKLGQSQAVVYPGIDSTEYGFDLDSVNAVAHEPLAFLVYGQFCLGAVTDVRLQDSEPFLFENGVLHFGVTNIVYATYITPIPEPSAIALALVALGIFRMRLVKQP